MKNWGFNISKPRGINLDIADTTLYKKMVQRVPSAKRCIKCGACSATCTAANHTKFSFRTCHIMFRHGQFEGLAKELDKCMLCGKCKLVCPRGINTRAIIYQMRAILNEESQKE